MASQEQDISPRTATFNISFRGQHKQVTRFLDETIASLKQYIQEETNLPAELQKLIYKGILGDSATLEMSKITDGVKVMLVASTEIDIRNVFHGDRRLHARNAMMSKRATSRKHNSIRNQMLTVVAHSQYTFHRVESLSDLNHPEKALEILNRLKNDWGIRQIMKEYKFSVGKLMELSPLHHSILGLNKNQGESISLRLRTDDLCEFRDYKRIRTILLHELTHNVHGPHDEKFYALNRQLEKDLKAYHGHSFGGEEYYHPVQVDDEFVYKGSTYTLGGSSKLPQTPAERREVIAASTLARLTREEVEINQRCGSANSGEKDSAARPGSSIDDNPSETTPKSSYGQPSD